MTFSRIGVSVLMILLLGTVANAQSHSCKSCGKKICQPELKTKKVKEIYYDVECVEVCIPSWRWPWQKCHPPRCGKVRIIHRLVKKEREVEKCVHEWNPVAICSDCLSCGAPECHREAMVASPESLGASPCGGCPGRAVPVPVQALSREQPWPGACRENPR